MRTRTYAIAAAAAAVFAGPASAFESGSTGANGIFNPTVSTAVPLPSSGIFNFTSVLIPVGVTVTFQKNETNTPVVILATGDVTISGTLNIGGSSSPAVGSAGNGIQGDDGNPGLGGPGGFDGGRGGKPGPVGSAGTYGGSGVGPGAGAGGICTNAGWFAWPGGGASYGTLGTGSTIDASFGKLGGTPGFTYGTAQLRPLIGGSGGGGGCGGVTYEGSGGGGGGGAVLIAASGTVTVSGSLLANGGTAGQSRGGGPNVSGGGGGGGSGGAIRIMATTIAGNGAIQAAGGGPGQHLDASPQTGGTGGAGRVRLEAQTITRTAATNPVATSDIPGQVFIAGSPSLRIASVAGVNAPASPSGTADVTLPTSTANPVTVVFETSGVPLGNTVELIVTPAYGAKSSSVSTALSGTLANATASATATLPTGPSVLFAQTTYTVVASVGDLLKNFAGNERVEKVTLMTALGGPAKAKLITVSGREYEVPAEVLRLASLGG